jgi:hypothetical protein
MQFVGVVYVAIAPFLFFLTSQHLQDREGVKLNFRERYPETAKPEVHCVSSYNSPPIVNEYKDGCCP